MEANYPINIINNHVGQLLGVHEKGAQRGRALIVTKPFLYRLWAPFKFRKSFLVHINGWFLQNFKILLNFSVKSSTEGFSRSPSNSITNRQNDFNKNAIITKILTIYLRSLLFLPRSHRFVRIPYY